MNRCAGSMLRLPGTAEEKQWLTERLEILDIAENDTLAAAMERSPPRTMADAVNHLLTLDQYAVYSAGSYEALGEIYLWEQDVPRELQPFFDKTALGQWYEDAHPGLFTGHHYVAYPKQEPGRPYDGTCPPAGAARPDWRVRLKLASEQVPDGVWVKLPDYNEMNDEIVSDLRLALDGLQAGTLHECTLLEARCALPGIQDLAGQYDSLEDLVYDGQELGMLLDGLGQVRPDLLDRFFAALELEGCRRLSDAVSVAGNLHSYELAGVDEFVDRVTEEMSGEDWAQADGCFDYAAYAAALAERQGYRMTGDGRNYIRRRDSPVLEQQPAEMTMR